MRKVDLVSLAPRGASPWLWGGGVCRGEQAGDGQGDASEEHARSQREPDPENDLENEAETESLRHLAGVTLARGCQLGMIVCRRL